MIFVFARLDPPASIPSLVWVGKITWGDSWRRHIDRSKGVFNDMLRHFLTTLRFMQQRILVDQPTVVTARAARRRLACAGIDDPQVRVILLRRRAYRAIDEETGVSVAWSCRWLVRGHWRAQFFPASGEHRPIWIAPYVKGPDGKPFRQPRETIFSVAR